MWLRSASAAVTRSFSRAAPRSRPVRQLRQWAQSGSLPSRAGGRVPASHTNMVHAVSDAAVRGRGGLGSLVRRMFRATLAVEAASAHATLLVRAFFAWIGAGPKWAAKTVSNLTVLGERCERVAAAVIVNRARSDAAKESAFASARTALRDTLLPLRFNLSSKPDLAPLIHSIRDLHPTHSISEGAAYRRLQTLKLCTSHPELEAQLRSGELTLTTAAQLRTALDREEKEQRGARRRPTAAPPVGREPRAVSLPRVAPAPEDPSPASEAHVPGAAPPPRPVSRTQGSCQATAAATHAAQRQPASRSQVASDLIEQAAGRSSREVARLIADRNPQASLPRERLRSLGGGRWELRAVIDDSCHAGLEQLRALLAHVDPALSYGELLARLVADGLGKYDPRRQKGRAAAAAPAPERQVTSAPKCAAADANQARAVVAAPAATAAAAGDLAAAAESGSAPTREPRACRAGSGGATGPPLPRSVPRYTGASAAAATPSQPPGGAVLVRRTIPAATRRCVWRRDAGACTFVDPETGQRCGSRHLLQIDHIQPFAMGGANSAENLRLLCAAHNRYRARKAVGSRRARNRASGP